MSAEDRRLVILTRSHICDLRHFSSPVKEGPHGLGAPSPAFLLAVSGVALQTFMAFCTLTRHIRLTVVYSTESNSAALLMVTSQASYQSSGVETLVVGENVSPTRPSLVA